MPTMPAAMSKTKNSAQTAWMLTTMTSKVVSGSPDRID